MNSLVFYIPLLLLAVTNLYTRAASDCDPNQVFCDLYNPPVSDCKPTCISGCVCQDGYVVYDGVCIPEEECPPLCLGNKTFQVRDIHVRTCDNIHIIPKEPGCYCEEGYLLNRNTNQCVLQEDCPKELNCQLHEQEAVCVNPCPATCSEPNPPICVLPRECEQGCICQSGYVRHTESGYCIKPQNCPDPCPGEHEEYQDCGTACEPFCGYIPAGCTKQCVSGCFCERGYIRECASKRSRCVLLKQCPSQEVID